MPRKTVPLSNTEVKNAKYGVLKNNIPTSKTYFDGDGLFLLVKPIKIENGFTESKLWRFKYRFDNKDKLISFGQYPEISLLDARERRRVAREQIAKGIDPQEERKEIKQEIAQAKADLDKQFHLTVLQWLDEQFKPDVAKITYDKTRRAIERDILPHFAKFKANCEPTFENVESSKLITDITESEVTGTLIIKSKSALDTAHRLCKDCKRIWKYTKTNGKIQTNILVELDCDDLLPKLGKNKHFASTTDPDKIKLILRFGDTYQGSIFTKTALRLLPYVFARMGNLRTMQWQDLDFDKKIWTVEEHKTSAKAGTAYLPLTDSAIAIINEIKPYSGHSKYVFPQVRYFNKPMSDNTLSKAYRDGELSTLITPHGFRTMFKSIAEENLHIHGINPKAIEACLFHKPEKDKVGDAYGHLAKYLDQMTIIMQWWADYLDNLRKS